MKKIIYIALAAAALAAASCAKNVDFFTDPLSDQGVSLKFYSSEMVTKATTDGLNNENLIKRIDYFFFPLNAEGGVDDETEYVYKNTLTPTDDGLAGSYSTVVEPGVLSQIFPDGATQAMVFAIANYVDKYGANNDMDNPNTTLPEDAKTWKALHDLEVGPTFFYDDKDPDFQLRWPHVLPTDDDNLFFVMTGELVVDLMTTGSYAVDAEVPLKRLASKVSVNFTYENCLEEKTSGNIMWVPQSTAGETRVFLSNAIEHTTIGGPLTRDYVADSWSTATKPLGNGTRDIFEYAYNFMNDVPVVDGKKTAHFYTYPINVAEGDDNQPYLKLVLPWYGYKYYGPDEDPEYDPEDPNWVLYKQKEVYYKIVLPRETIKDPNCIYEYSVKVNIIGSDKEVKIIGEEYVVKNWLSGDPISANVATGRYISLEIPKDEYDMYVDEIDINFVSSGTVVPIIKEIYQMDLSGSNPVPRYFMQDDEVVATDALMTAKRINAAAIEGWVTIPAESSYLKINHALDNRLLINGEKNTAFDMSPYVYVVTLHLEDEEDDTFDRTVTITQYPSMYATSVKSNGVVFVNTWSYDNPAAGTGNNTHWAWNNRNTTTDSERRIGSIVDPDGVNGSGTNNSQHSIIVHPTVLDEALDLVIGEAREATGSTLQYINNLTNYKAGRGDDAAKKVVSPGFMIASSYGKTQPLDSFDRAKERCATYQENGYPAGRWRVPTAGEIKFLIQLSDAGFIPSLFNARYYQSDGSFYESSGSTSNSIYVRCVYDTWFWGEEPYQENATSWLGFQTN
ncbi:MAG: hypothetical protein IJK55_05050 [Bacteroidales bacterium]|nr:hypothetical protein [Bacteroidales bacterium]